MTAPPAARHTLTLTAGRARFSVGGLDDADRAALLRDWSRCEPRDAADEASVDLHRDPQAAWEDFHESLVFRATAQAIESGRGTHLMFHGACLADPATGAGIVLAAASGTGKTTATRVLGRGHAYLTDETAILDVEDLTVSPYAKPLSVLGPDGRRPKTQLGPDELGLGATREARVRRIAVLDRVRDAAEPVAARAEPMELVDALRELVPQTSSLSSLPRGLVTLCSVLDRLGGAQRLVYSEAADLAPVVDTLLADEPVPVPAAWKALDEAELAESEPAGPAAPEASRLRRVQAQCGIALDDGRLVLLVDQRLLVLDGVGPALWSVLEAERSQDEILTEFAGWGPLPSDAPDVLASAVAALQRVGLLVTAAPERA